MAITIIGLPWSFAALRIAFYTLLPFGHEMRSRPDAGVLSTLGNIVWFVLAGWWLAIIHLVLAVALAVTIIGLPFRLGAPQTGRRKSCPGRQGNRAEVVIDLRRPILASRGEEPGGELG
jgi:hypothetical protein